MVEAKWMKIRKKTDPELPYEPPILLGDKSNGEFYHQQTKRERKLRDLILRTCDDRARKLGMDRREFIASAMGMATSLSILNLASGCGDKNGYLPMSMAEDVMKANAGASGVGAGSAAGWSAGGAAGVTMGGPLAGMRPGGGGLGGSAIGPV